MFRANAAVVFDDDENSFRGPVGREGAIRGNRGTEIGRIHFAWVAAHRAGAEFTRDIDPFGAGGDGLFADLDIRVGETTGMPDLFNVHWNVHQMRMSLVEPVFQITNVTRLGGNVRSHNLELMNVIAIGDQVREVTRIKRRARNRSSFLIVSGGEQIMKT